MGWINRAKAKASRLLSYVEEDSRSCIPTSQHCYIFVPYMVDLRAGVVGIAVFQAISGVACFFAVQLLLNPDSSSFPDQEIRSTRAGNILVVLLDQLIETSCHYFDLAFQVMSAAVGILGCVLLSDSDAIFSYTDRGMLKIGVYTRATLFLAALAALRFALWALCRMTRPSIYNIPWWYIAPLTFFSLYHAYVVWCFNTKLKRQYDGDFEGAPVMHGQAPPGLVIEPSHFQPLELIIPSARRGGDGQPRPEALVEMPGSGKAGALDLSDVVVWWDEASTGKGGQDKV
mmetsp:Transcript_41178/g.105279  ORF Transcript_41178/g.105279 Transcript_41178/m.105279 type:complete len:287 (+) Transcript_41178:198-1058(+)